MVFLLEWSVASSQGLVLFLAFAFLVFSAPPAFPQERDLGRFIQPNRSAPTIGFATTRTARFADYGAIRDDGLEDPGALDRLTADLKGHPVPPEVLFAKGVYHPRPFNGKTPQNIPAFDAHISRVNRSNCIGGRNQDVKNEMSHDGKLDRHGSVLKLGQVTVGMMSDGHSKFSPTTVLPASAHEKKVSAPIHLSVSSLGEAAVTLVWQSGNRSTNDSSYEVYQDGKKILVVTQRFNGFLRPAALITSLEPGTTYQFTVRSVIGGVSISEASDPLSVTLPSTNHSANMALGMRTFSDSILNDGALHKNAVDGVATKLGVRDLSSYWISDRFRRAHWLGVDLKRPRHVNRFIIKHAGVNKPGEAWNNTKDFSIQGSFDGEEWETLLTVSNNSADLTSHTAAHAFFRYFRIYVTDPSCSDPKDNTAKIAEFEVYSDSKKNSEVILTPFRKNLMKANPIFADNMVLQQKMKIPVWGNSFDGDEITISFLGQKVSTKVVGGKWRIDLPAVDAGGPYEMTIAGTEKVIILKNVWVGEVWLASGQSNMERPLFATENGEKEYLNASCPGIKIFVMSKEPEDSPQENVKGGAWIDCVPANGYYLSAIGYYFSREIHRIKNTPVGLILAAVSGTSLQAWTSVEVMDSLYPNHSKEFGAAGRPSGLYNGLIAPLMPYSMRGVIWYQGENNVYDTRYDYEKLFPGMIENWRANWGLGDFPFLFAQISSFGGAQESGAWAKIREAQLRTQWLVKNTGMAVTIDYGDKKDVHPMQKYPVAYRLAQIARAKAYGEDIEFSGPLYAEMKIVANKIILSFTHCGSGLLAVNGELQGFTISSDGNKFIVAHAEITPDDKVVVSSDQINTPTVVRYGWENYPIASLYNREGFPASPFRTDMTK